MAGKQDRINGATWLHLLAYSIVALCALLWVPEVGKVSDESSSVQWTVAALSTSVAFSALAAIAELFMKHKFAGTAIEGGLVRLGSRCPK
jgi:hypothetical protein